MWYISDDMPTGFGIEVKTNEPLKIYTTFKIGGPARFFTSVRNEDEVRQAYGFWREQSLGETPFVLGGGSNILVSDHGVDTLVIHMANEGISLASEDAGSVTLSIAAGEPWDNVVRYAVEHGWWGIENLSHIPGQAGAALVQNIGAYGQQISDVLKTAEVMDTEIRQVMSLAAAECEFGYRKSIFNSTRKNRYLILGLVLTLKKQGRRNLSYPDVQSYFEARHMNRPGLAEIRNAIIEIRDRKFPFPKEERGGNAGSFFKNLVLSSEEFQALASRIEREFGPPARKRLNGVRRGGAHARQVRIPTAFLIDLCGLKGWQEGEAKVNENQPLVILNTGGATATEVLRLAKHIRGTIYRRTGIEISVEPELVGFTRDEIADFLNLTG